jgi:hypothetical protein
MARSSARLSGGMGRSLDDPHVDRVSNWGRTSPPGRPPLAVPAPARYNEFVALSSSPAALDEVSGGQTTVGSGASIRLWEQDQMGILYRRPSRCARRRRRTRRPAAPVRHRARSAHRRDDHTPTGRAALARLPGCRSSPTSSNADTQQWSRKLLPPRRKVAGRSLESSCRSAGPRSRRTTKPPTPRRLSFPAPTTTPTRSPALPRTPLAARLDMPGRLVHLNAGSGPETRRSTSASTNRRVASATFGGVRPSIRPVA